MNRVFRTRTYLGEANINRNPSFPIDVSFDAYFAFSENALEDYLESIKNEWQEFKDEESVELCSSMIGRKRSMRCEMELERRGFRRIGEKWQKSPSTFQVRGHSRKDG